LDDRDDFAVDDIHRAVALNDDDAGGFTSGNLAVFVVDAAVEQLIFALKAAFVLAGGGRAVVAAACAVEGPVEIGHEEDGEVWIEAPAHSLVQAQDGFASNLAAAPLVSLGGIGKAVAEDDVSAVEGGRDDLGDALGAVGEHEAQLRHGVEALGFRVKKQRSDAVADVRTPGLASDRDVEALRFKMRGEFAELSRFAGAIQALKGEEKTSRHGNRVQGAGNRVQGLRVESGTGRWRDTILAIGPAGGPAVHDLVFYG
jgi:hypothetical protein